MAASSQLGCAPGTVPAGPLIVELAGTPGSGKTTAVAEVHRALGQEGFVSFDPEAGARSVASRTLVGRLVHLLPSETLRDVLGWRVYLAYRLFGAGRVILRRPLHFIWLVRRQIRRPKEARARRRRVLHWYLRMAGSQEFYRSFLGPGEAVVYEEGYAHRVVQLFSSPADRGSAGDVARYLDGAYPPDLLIHVKAPPEACLERINERGVWERLVDLTGEDLETFVSNANHMLRHAMSHVEARGWNVTVVDNSGAVPSLVDRTSVAVRRGLPRRPTRRAGTLTGPVIPRPRHFVRLVRGRVSPAVVAVETVDALLAELGTERHGRISNLPLARRSRSVRVASGLGPLVLRAYPHHWPAESLRHEHSLLLHLEKNGYPSVRLVTFPRGTLFEYGGQRLAAYRFVAGRNLSGSYLGSRLVEEAHTVGGALLAGLHRLTTDLHLPNHHHLSMQDGKERLRSDLALLEELSEYPEPDSHLVARKDEIGERLARLHATLMGANPSVAIIHGDFGLHNVLVRHDGAATVVDFELARRDWCLVDIVEALSPMSAGARKAFLSGYADAVGGEPDEWRLLPSMWEYHRLSGAVRAWQSFQRRGEPNRLVVARRRLSEADRVAERGTAGWL